MLGRDSSVGIATGYGAGLSGDRIPVEAIFTAPVQTGPWGLSNLLYNGYWVFPAGKDAGAWRWPLTLSSAKVKERVKLYIYSPYRPPCPVLDFNFTFTATRTTNAINANLSL